MMGGIERAQLLAWSSLEYRLFSANCTMTKAIFCSWHIESASSWSLAQTTLMPAMR